jgi:phytoene desaturase
MYHLMSRLDLADGVLYPDGGFVRVPETIASLAEEAGARLHTGATVTGITTRPGAGLRKRPAVAGVRYRDSAGEERWLRADVVVGAADLHHLETELLPRSLQTYPDEYWQSRDPGPGAVLACLGVDGPIPQLPHHALFFTEDWRSNFDDIFGADRRVPDPASIYVCKPSETDASVAPEGSENLFVLVPVPADVELGSGGLDGRGDPQVEKVVDAAIDQISSWAGVPDLASRVRVRRSFGPGDFARDLNAWSGGALGPAHTLRQSAFFRTGNVSRKVSGLHYAGASTVPGIGLPMCLISAQLVVKRLRGDRSSAPLDVTA